MIFIPNNKSNVNKSLCLLSTGPVLTECLSMLSCIFSLEANQFLVRFYFNKITKLLKKLLITEGNLALENVLFLFSIFSQRPNQGQLERCTDTCDTVIILMLG